MGKVYDFDYRQYEIDEAATRLENYSILMNLLELTLDQKTAIINTNDPKKIIIIKKYLKNKVTLPEDLLQDRFRKYYIRLGLKYTPELCMSDFFSVEREGFDVDLAGIVKQYSKCSIIIYHLLNYY